MACRRQKGPTSEARRWGFLHYWREKTFQAVTDYIRRVVGFFKAHRVFTSVVSVVIFILTLVGGIASFRTIQNWYFKSDLYRDRISVSLEKTVQNKNWKDFEENLKSIEDNKDLSGLYERFLKKYAEKLFNDKDWSSLSRVLKPVKSNKDFSDLYNYAQGVSVMKNGIVGSNPEAYFYKIDRGSEYFLKALKKLKFFYQEQYKGDTEVLRVKLMEMADAIKKSKVALPYFFLIRIEAVGFKNYSAVERIWVEFRSAYSRYIDFNSYEVVIKVKEGRRGGGLHIAVQLPAICYLLQAALAVSAHNESLHDKKQHALNEVEKILKKHGQPALRMIFKSQFHTSFDDRHGTLIKMRPELKNVGADLKKRIDVKIIVTPENTVK